MPIEKPQAGFRATLKAINHRLNNPEFIDYLILLFLVIAVAMLFGRNIKTFIRARLGTSNRGLIALPSGRAHDQTANIPEENFRTKPEKLVEEVLMKDWDPLGVNDIPEASDEYDSYALRIYGMIYHGASEEMIQEYLNEVAKNWMGLKPDAIAIEKTAKAIMALDLPRKQK